MLEVLATTSMTSHTSVKCAQSLRSTVSLQHHRKQRLQHSPKKKQQRKQSRQPRKLKGRHQRRSYQLGNTWKVICDSS